MMISRFRQVCSERLDCRFDMLRPVMRGHDDAHEGTVGHCCDFSRGQSVDAVARARGELDDVDTVGRKHFIEVLLPCLFVLLRRTVNGVEPQECILYREVRVDTEALETQPKRF